MLEFLFEMFEATKKHVPAITFDGSDSGERVIISLYATIIEQADSVITLLKNGKYVGVDIIIRSAFEGLVDLINVAADKRYINTMLAADHKAWIKLANEGIGGTNRYLALFRNNAEATEKLKEREKALEDLKVEGFKPLRIEERFALAGWSDEYKSMYTSLCAEAHNSVSALSSRHFREDEDGRIEVVIYAEPEELSVETSVDMLLSILDTANLKIHDVFGSGALDEMKSWSARLNQLREEAAS